MLPRLLRIAAHNLDLLRRDVVLIVQLEIDILDEERPDLVAEAVCIQMTLLFQHPPVSPNDHLRRGKTQQGTADLEVHARLDLVC